MTLLTTVVLLNCLFTFPAEAETLDVRIKGLKGEKLKNIQMVLELPPGIVRDNRVNWRWAEHFKNQVPERVSKTLKPFGYFHSRTTAILQQPSADRNILWVTVETGKPVVLTEVNVAVEGMAGYRPEVIRAVRAFPLKNGDVIRQDKYTEGKRAILLAAVNHGFLKAVFTRRQIRIYPEKNQAEIDLFLSSGPQHYFGETTIIGAVEYPPSFLRRYLDFKPGDLYLDSKRTRTRSNFQSANRFEDVILISKIAKAENSRVPIEVNLETLPAKRLRNGIGYGDNTGARLSSNYQDVNVAGTGREFNADITLGQKYQLAELRYIIPGHQHVDDADVLSAGLEREDINPYENHIGFVEWEKLFSLGTGKVGSFYLRYFQERFEISEEDERTHLLMPGMRYVQRSYDDPVNPRKGYQYRLELRGSEDTLGSDITLLQGLAAGAIFWPLIEKYALLLRLEGGYTIKDNDFDEIPASLRFFTGGNNSVRGYAYKSRGPVDKNGDVTGGEALLVGSMELEREIGEHWGLAAFYDIGSAFNPTSEIRFIQGAGIGLRIYTPVGPIKIDLAHQINEDDPSARFHLSIGFDL